MSAAIVELSDEQKEEMKAQLESGSYQVFITNNHSDQWHSNVSYPPNRPNRSEIYSCLNCLST